jgi:hypothetical protein
VEEEVMAALDENEVSTCLGIYFSAKGLDQECQFNLFNHVTDKGERTFKIDLACKPFAAKGDRSPEQRQIDEGSFNSSSDLLETALSPLDEALAFPSESDRRNGWSMECNPNPMAALAVEIENSGNKYLLGSLLAASIAGRWGVLVIPEGRSSDLWLATIRRVIHKGSRSPIPSNIRIFKWPALRQRIEELVPEIQTM